MPETVHQAIGVVPRSERFTRADEVSELASKRIEHDMLVRIAAGMERDDLVGSIAVRKNSARVGLHFERERLRQGRNLLKRDCKARGRFAHALAGAERDGNPLEFAAVECGRYFKRRLGTRGRLDAAFIPIPLVLTGTRGNPTAARKLERFDHHRARVMPCGGGVLLWVLGERDREHLEQMVLTHVPEGADLVVGRSPVDAFRFEQLDGHRCDRLVREQVTKAIARFVHAHYRLERRFAEVMVDPVDLLGIEEGVQESVEPHCRLLASTERLFKQQLRAATRQDAFTFEVADDVFKKYRREREVHDEILIALARDRAGEGIISLLRVEVCGDVRDAFR